LTLKAVEIPFTNESLSLQHCGNRTTTLAAGVKLEALLPSVVSHRETSPQLLSSSTYALVPGWTAVFAFNFERFTSFRDYPLSSSTVGRAK